MPYGTVLADNITDSYGGKVSPISVPFRNRIINGAMVIDQRNAGASVTPTLDGQYGSCDRWMYWLSQASKFSVQQSTVAPTGFSNSLLITSLSAYAVTGTDYFAVNQKIEGFNFSDLGWGTANAQTVTLSFWVRSSLTGTFGAAFTNSATNRSYPFNYTINVANTWEQKTVTVAGDTTGTWIGSTNGIGAIVQFNLGSVAAKLGTAGTWGSAWYTGATGAQSVVGTNGATFYITGVQLEKGSNATSFDYRSIGTELALCQRYYQKTYAQGTAPGSVAIPGSFFTPASVANNYQTIGNWNFAVVMRATPTIVGYSNANGASGSFNADSTTLSPIGIQNIGDRSAAFYAGNVAVGQYAFVQCHATASAEL
jgi:hypothetical protein